MMQKLKDIGKFIKNSCGFLTKKGAWIDYDEVHALAYGFMTMDDDCVIHGDSKPFPSYVEEEPHYFELGKELRKLIR